MAEKKSTQRFKREIRIIALDHVHRDPRQPREKFDEAEIEALARSIRSEGLLQPSTVRPDPLRAGHYILVAGERRFRALQINHEEEYEFIVVQGLEGRFKSNFVASVVENLHRIDLNPIEEAKALVRLRDEDGLTIDEIFQLTGRTPHTIKNKIKLLELPEEVQQMVIDGKLPQGGAINLAQFRGPKGATLQRAMALAAGKDPIELGMVYETAEGGFGSRVKVPPTTDRQLRRILSFSWRTKGELAVFEAFLKAPKEHQLRALRGVVKRALDGLKAAMQKTEELTHEFNKLVNENAVNGISEDFAVAAAAREFADRRYQPPRRLTDAEVQRLAKSYGNGNGNGNGSAAKKITYPPASSFAPEDLVRAKAILGRIFPGNSAVNLNKRLLAVSLENSRDGVEKTARWALGVAASWWREPLPPAPGPQRDFAMLVTKLRVTFPGKSWSIANGHSCFGDFLEALKEHGHCGSPDTVSLDGL